MYAIDIDRTSLEILRFIIETYFPGDKDRLVLVHSEPDDIKVPPETFDVVIMNDNHFFYEITSVDKKRRVKACLTTLLKAMKPKGRLYVVENVNSTPLDGYKNLKGLPQEQINALGEIMVAPFIEVGFKLENSIAQAGLFAFVFSP